MLGAPGGNSNPSSSSSSSSSSFPVAIVVPSIIGGVLLIVIVVVVICCCLKKKQKSKPQSGSQGQQVVQRQMNGKTGVPSQSSSHSMNHTPEMDPNYQNFGPASNQHYLHNQDVYQHKYPEATPQPYMWSFTSPIYYSFIIIALAPICNNYVIILPIMIYFDLLLCLFL